MLTKRNLKIIINRQVLSNWPRETIRGKNLGLYDANKVVIHFSGLFWLRILALDSDFVTRGGCKTGLAE